VEENSAMAVADSKFWDKQEVRRGSHDFNLIVNPFYPLEMSDDFLSNLFEVVGVETAS
jgi:hypothetical protein